jgi:hypothetical protein
MAKDWRIAANGRRLDYTCENARFRTDVVKGEKHGRNHTCGSVFREPLFKSVHGYSLWLEHVVDRKTSDRSCYWLMWYERGRPTVPMSAILREDDLTKMAQLLMSRFTFGRRQE